MEITAREPVLRPARGIALIHVPDVREVAKADAEALAAMVAQLAVVALVRTVAPEIVVTHAQEVVPGPATPPALVVARALARALVPDKV